MSRGIIIQYLRTICQHYYLDSIADNHFLNLKFFILNRVDKISQIDYCMI